MLLEVRLAVEGLPALEALVGLLPGVDDGVLNESSAVTETLPTLTALIGLLPGGDQVVLEEVCALAEGSPILCASIGLHSRVKLLMSNKEAMCVKSFPTFPTLTGEVPFMSQGSFHQPT